MNAASRALASHRPDIDHVTDGAERVVDDAANGADGVGDDRQRAIDHVTHGAERVGDGRHHAGGGHIAACRLETHDAAESGGNANGPAGVRADRRQAHPKGHGHRRATAGAAGDSGGVGRMSDRTEG